MSKEINIIGAEELDILFDEGEEDILQYFDMENAVRLGDEQEKVTLSLPKWMSDSIDGEAKRLGVTRQAIIKIWLDEKLQGISA
ncbi:MAG: BrnA antitoxin family protein [Clostridiales Family XIII bacterium]|nr:BrnA antitoxin family protein [Clostridiales Family XIII bacterium]